MTTTLTRADADSPSKAPTWSVTTPTARPAARPVTAPATGSVTRPATRSIAVSAAGATDQDTGSAPGVTGLVVLVVVAVLVVAVGRWVRRLRRRSPWVWWPLLGMPVALARVAVTWRRLCEGCDLVVAARRSTRYGLVGAASSRDRGRSRGGGVIVRGQPVRVVIPRRVGVRVTGTGMAVTVRLLASQTPAQFEKAADAIRHAWRMHEVVVTTPRPGRVLLTATAYDPLRHPRPPRHPSRTSRRSRVSGRSLPGRVSWRPRDRPPGKPPRRAPRRPPAGPPPSTPRTPRRRRVDVVLWQARRLRVAWTRWVQDVSNLNATVTVDPVPFDAVDPAAVDVVGAVVPEVVRVPVGVRQDGRTWVIDLGRRPHHLVTGATQSGKSTLTVALVAGLAARPVVLVGIDAKGGVELGPLEDRLTLLATTRGGAATVLEAVVSEVLHRMLVCRGARVRSVWDLPVDLRPAPVVVVVDEVAELFLHADRAGKEEVTRCVTSLVRIAQLGAAAAVHLWIAGQRFGSDLGPGATLLRAQLAGRICHRVADIETAEMTLAGLGPQALDAALSIPDDLPGVAVVGDDTGAWTRARSTLLTLDDAAAVTHTYAGLARQLTSHVPELARLLPSRLATAGAEQDRGEHDRAAPPHSHDPARHDPSGDDGTDYRSDRSEGRRGDGWDDRREGR